MKFEMWKCNTPGCGYKACTAEDQPVCQDCGADMVVISDENERAEFDSRIRQLLRTVVNR